MTKAQKILIAEDFIEEKHPISKVLGILNIPSSSFYYKPVNGVKNRGVSKSKFTRTIGGELVDNIEVVGDIKSLLSQEFVDYGYHKVTHWLKQNKGYIINKKKVYRLMSEHDLLNKKPVVEKAPRLWVSELVPQPNQVMEHLEFDIKYIHVSGKRRNALVLTVIDVKSRWVLGQYLNWKINEYDVRNLFEKIFSYYDLPKVMYVRNDNGSQFVAKLVRQYFENKDVIQEFTRPATPQQNAHIESYHSIMERVICQRYELGSLEEAQITFNRWIKFYNFDRIHSGIQYLSPVKFLKQKGYDIEWNHELEVTLDCKAKSFNTSAN